MSVPLTCLLIAVIIPYVLAGVGGYFRTRQLGSLDNNNPREQAKELTGAGARAVAAQANAWEALSVFAAAVLTAHVTGADPVWSARLAVLFLIARGLHGVFYVADIATARSLSFMVGLVCCLGLFGLSFSGGGAG